MPGRRLSITGHLDELRRRLWVCVGAIAVGSAVSLNWARQAMTWLKRPAGEALPQLAFFSPPEGFLAYLRVAMACGIVLAMPVALYETWAFIRPGLTPQERRYGAAFIGWGSALFLAGAAFAYWVVLPVSLTFLLGFGEEQLVPVISVSRYLSFTTTVLLASGFVFEVPIAVWCLARVGLVNAGTLRRRWRESVVVMVVAAALLTPTTDAATLCFMVIPMLVLYGISIWIARWAAPREPRDG